MTTPTDLTQLAEFAAAQWPAATAWVFDETGETLTFRQVHDRARRLASVLRRHGIAEGDRVAVMLDNRPEFPLTWLAAAYLGAALVPVNITYREVDAGHVLTHSGASVIVTSQRFLPLVNRLRSRSDLRTVLSVDGGEGAQTVSCVEGDADAQAVKSAARPETPANIQYTSGTTGKPKGCVLPQRYWTTLVAGMVSGHPNLGPEDVILTAQPFHYIDPQWNVAAGLASGARLVVLDRFHPSTFWHRVREHRVTWFYCLGLMPALLLKMPAALTDRDHCVRAVHCSAIPTHLHRALEERWGVPWYETFGMTESGADIRLGPEDHDEVVGTGCLGRPLPHREIQVATSAGVPVPVGETGELMLRGLGLMLGYYDDHEATRSAFGGGWFHTGDLVRTDRQGRIYYIGRIKDSIRRSGENISAAEVEDVLTQHPAVSTVAVVPVTDELRGEEVRAFVVPEPGRAPGQELADELDEFCKERLAYFKVPRYWTFRRNLPMTASERVAKGELRAETVGADTFERSH